MARGWESKSVEDQMAQVESDRRDRAKVGLTPEEMERQSFYDPTDRGFEAKVKERLDYWEQQRKELQQRTTEKG